MSSVSFFLLFTLILPSVRPVFYKGSNRPKCGQPVHNSITPCYCDSACTFYDDCCHRYFKSKRYFACQKLSALSVDIDDYAFVVNECPSNTQDPLKQLCEKPVEQSDPLDRSIVISGKEVGLFRNVYCAVCHRASYEEPTLAMKCKKELNVSKMRNESRHVFFHELDARSMLAHGCRLAVTLNFRKYRSCRNTQLIASSCPRGWARNWTPSLLLKQRNVTSMNVEERCMNAPTKYTRCDGDDRTFRNPYCQICLRDNCLPYINLPSLGKGNKGIPPYSYSIITDFKRLSDMGFALTPNGSEENATAFNNSTEKFENSLKEALSYLTLSFCILSVLSLIVLMIVFAAIPSLRNFGGILTLSLATSLLLGLICFLIGPNVRHLVVTCHIVAIVMYFAYFSSFAWMSLFAVDVFKTFTTTGASGASRGGNKMRRFAKFAVGGWLLPLVVTAAAVTVDAVWPQGVVSAGFGRGQCYFNNGYALLAWFYVPVAVAVVANAVMCVAVIAAVWRKTKQTKDLRRDREPKKKMVLLSVKITAIFGVTWVLGLSAALIADDWFTEISGLVDSLQGTFVSLAFLLNSRTIRKAKSLYASDSSSVKRKTTNGTAEKRSSKSCVNDL